MERKSCLDHVTRRSKFGIRVRFGPKIATLGHKLTLFAFYTATLELKTEKANAHSGSIWSVDFSPDGSKIVSGSSDKTIKVWDSGAFWA